MTKISKFASQIRNGNKHICLATKDSPVPEVNKHDFIQMPIIGRTQDNFEKERVKLNRKRTPKTFVSGPKNLGVKKVFKIN